ncbi:MAG: DNA-3-methyladenine glycosylase family protein [Acidimicrobiales bacterium]
MTAANEATATTYRPRQATDLRFALLGVASVTSVGGVRWWSTVTPDGPASVAFRTGTDGTIRADAWGPGTDWALTQLPSLLGADDETVDDFRPTHPVVRHLAGQFASLRLGSTNRWYEALTAAAIGQRVVAADARTSRTRLAFRYGRQPVALAPVPAFPEPGRMLRLPDHDFHCVGIDRGRARVVRVAARYAERIEQLAEVPGADADQLLQRLPGVGPWTAALATSVAGGHADAVPVGDLHIPRLVSRALSGEDGDDNRMLELLEPFRGHRQRVVRLIKLAARTTTANRPAPTRSDISRI